MKSDTRKRTLQIKNVILLKVLLISFAFFFSFQNCDSGAPPANKVTVQSYPDPAPSIQINIVCPLSVVANISNSCSATATGTLQSGYWTINGTKQANPPGVVLPASFAFSQPIGSYTIQAVGLDAQNNSFYSNSQIVQVNAAAAASVSISCPSATVSMGLSLACTAVTTGAISSGYWTLDGVKILGSDNQLAFNYSPPSSGNHILRGVVQDAQSNIYFSNQLTINTPVASAGTLAITCPASVQAPADGLCSAVASVTLTSISWTVNSGIPEVGSIVTPLQHTWTSPPAGTYSIQAVALDSSGKSIASNRQTVTVIPQASPSISISCPTSVAVNTMASCTASANASSILNLSQPYYWTVNGTQDSAHISTFNPSWSITPAMSGMQYTIQFVGFDLAGNFIKSNAIVVNVH